MKKYIITISREFGCGAREISRQLASELCITLYDKELVSMAAQRSGLNSDILKEADEMMDSRINKLFKEFVYGSSTKFYSEQAILAQVQVIRDLADKKDSCIMLGRCSDYILREYPNVINIFLYAPLEARISHISDAYQLDRVSAEKMIKRVDKQRHNYYKYVTGYNRGDREEKHLMIDVAKYGVKGTVKLISEAVSILFEDKD